MLPRVAIVGRPNVGKSSLFNRLVGRRVSIVDPTPGTTRDRIGATVELRPDGPRGSGEPRFIDLVDTGGYGVYTAEGKRFDDTGADLARLTPDIEAQILEGARRADLILFVTDAQTGAVSLDDRIAELLRREGLSPKVTAIANKCDDTKLEMEAADLARLGFGMPMCVSAKAGRGVAKLRAMLWERAGPQTERAPNPEMQVAIVGRRNAGKSSLVNALAGEPRVIVSEIAGTTRDSVDVRFEIGGRVLVAIDTAGVRKRKSWDGDIEFYSHQRTRESIRRADVCVLLLDAVEKVSQIEKTLGQELIDSFKPTIIAVNKWDLVRKNLKPKDYLKYLEQELPGLAYAPILFLSASTREGVRDLIAMCFNLHQQAGHRETTGKVNAAIKEILEHRGPSSKLGTKAKVFYVSQIDVRPPTIAMVVNKPSLFEGAYERYLLNRLREYLPFSEVPIRVILSARRRVELPKKRVESSKSRAGSHKRRGMSQTRRAGPTDRRAGAPTRGGRVPSRRRRG